MSQADDHTYYTQRSADEMDHGDRAVSPAIAAIHYELAHRYSLVAFAKDGGKLTLVAPRKQDLAA